MIVGKKQGIMVFIKDTLTKNAPSDDQIKPSVETLYLSTEEAKYVMTRLATRMQTATKELKVDEANLEHIFPKRPSDEWVVMRMNLTRTFGISAI